MGVSTDAMLFYGFAWEDEVEWPDDYDDDNGTCQVDWHGSDSYMLPCIYVTESFIIAHRGCPKAVPSLEVKVCWDDDLQKYLSSLGVEAPEGQTPAWRLVSWYG